MKKKKVSPAARPGPVVVRSGVYTPEQIAAIRQAYPEVRSQDNFAASEIRQPSEQVSQPASAAAPTPFAGLKGVLDRLKATSSIAKMVEARRSNDKSVLAEDRFARSKSGVQASGAFRQPTGASEIKPVPYPQTAIAAVAQAPLPQPTYAPPVAAYAPVASLALPTAPAAISELRGPVPKPVFRKAICIITKNLNGLHVMLGKPKTIRSTDQFFRVGKHSFLLDIGRAFMVGPRGAYVMYDIDVAEPIERVVLDRRGNPTATHAPLEFGDQVHYSEPLDMTLQSKVFEQAFRALGEGNAFSYMWLIMLLVGAVLGYFAGNTFPANKAVTVITTTTTAGKMLALALMNFAASKIGGHP